MVVAVDAVVSFVVVDDAVGDAAAKGWSSTVDLRSAAGGASEADEDECSSRPSSPCNCCKGNAPSKFSRQTMH